MIFMDEVTRNGCLTSLVVGISSDDGWFRFAMAREVDMAHVWYWILDMVAPDHLRKR